MGKIDAFVGHSFTEGDKDVVRQFLDFFNTVANMGLGFSWVHAEIAEPKILSEKVLNLMEGKNLFIGICTAKEKTILPEKLKAGFFNKNELKSDAGNFESKTSDWIIQEIGVAKGMKMNVMLLLEDGLRDPGGLQGDLEYIPFFRKDPSKAFSKIIEMLTAMSPKKTSDRVAPLTEDVTTEEKKVVEEKKADLEPKETWSQTDYDKALLRVIATGNEEKEKEIVGAYAKSNEGQSANRRVSFEALSLFYRHLLGKGSVVGKLEELQKNNPTNDDVLFYLADVYEKYQDYAKAAEHYEKAAQVVQDNNLKLTYLCNAAAAYYKNNAPNRAEKVLLDAKTLSPTVENGDYKILLMLRGLAIERKDDDLNTALAERMLEIRPEDNDLRFSLAYKYSEQNSNALALYHYLLIPSNQRSETTWNNVGVAYSKLEMDGKAVEAYRESEDLNGTLAMSNLAHKLIEAGFLKEAEELCSAAIKVENYDKQIGTAISSIKEKKEKEVENQKRILGEIEKRRKFYAAFGQACIKQSLENHEGSWAGPRCDFNLTVAGNTVRASGKYERELGGFLAAALAGKAKADVKKETVVINYEGELVGHGVKFKKIIKTQSDSSTSLLSAVPAGQVEIQGLMIFSDDLSKISIYEKDNKDSEKYYEFVKKQA